MSINDSSKQKGFSLLEVLLAWLIVSVSILALLQGQRNSLVHIQQAYYRTQASIRLFSLAQLFYASPTSSIRQRLFDNWQQTTKQLLIYSESHYHCSGHSCNLSLSYNGRFVFTLKQPVVVP